MSADSPRRLSRKGSTGHVVLPQPVSDPSIIDSVAGFIHEVIPQAYSSVLPGDSRESIAWARFEQADYNDPSLYPDAGDDCDSTPPLLLVLGYSNGVQVWSIGSSGEAVEVLSWNQRVVRTLRFLPAPLPSTSPTSQTPHQIDPFAHKRPLIALVDNSGPPPHFSTCSFISLHGGDQAKSIKFKNPICDVLANRRSIVITFVERIAVFDALTLEDRLTITTCYPSPGVCPNPVALGSRWLAYADKRLVSWWRSLGGCDVEGAHGSYTASVLHAAKSLGKGLRGLSGHVASHLSGGAATTGVGVTVNGGGDASCTPGVVTVLDIEGNLSSGWSSNGGVSGGGAGSGAVGENIVAHFVAHLEPVVALAFDPSGMLLLTVDKRGHRFHLFRIQPHLSGSSLSEVHQLYTLYRGDTTARIQDIAFSCDSRWVAVSSLRGTTHVFPITPYGGSIGVRTHTTPHVVNKLSRFHRSAGLSDEKGCGRNSPVPHDAGSQGGPPLTPPLPHRGGQPPSHLSVTVQPLAQLRRHYPQPQAATAAAGGTTASHVDSDAAQVRVAACFAPPRASLPPSLLMSHVATTTTATTATPPPPSSLLQRQRRPLDSVYVMSAHGTLLQYDLEPRHITGLSKDRISDDTAIELAVDAKAEWLLMSPPLFNPVQPPLSAANPLLQLQLDSPRHVHIANCMTKLSSTAAATQQDEHWLSQVEIVTHAGPHRRLWMGPQFIFKTYSLSSSDLDKDSVEVGTIPVQSNPINVPMRPPLLIESGSTSSLEQSPHLTEVYQNEFEFSLDHGESRLREDLADAMQESPNMPGRRWSVVECVGGGGGQGQRRSTVVERRVNPLGTIIMVQQQQQSTTPELSTQVSRQSADHLIVVAAESLSTSSKNNRKQPQVPASCDVTGSSQKKNSIVISNNRVVSCGQEAAVIGEDDNEKVEMGKSTNNNKERRKNAKNDRNKSINVDKSISVEKSIHVNKSINVDRSLVIDRSITVDKTITVDNSTKNDSIESSVDLVKLDAEEESRNEKQPILEQSTDCVSRASKRRSKNNGKKLDEVVVKGGSNLEKESVEVLDNFKENVEETGDNMEGKVDGEVDILLSGGGDDEAPIVMSDKLQGLSIFELGDKSPPTVETEKDREYPALTTSVKTKRKCRTLGKKISKVVDDKQVTKQDEIDLLECQPTTDHSLMDFPDLLLANVKVVDSRRESIAQVVIETIEKDNMIKNEVEEESVTKRVEVKMSDKEETTDKDSSDDCLSSTASSSKCDVKGGGVGSGGGGGKKRKNRKKEGKGGEVLSDSDVSPPPDSVEVIKSDEVEEPKKFSWSQITSMGGKKNSGEAKQVEEDVEAVIQPEIISWNKGGDSKVQTNNSTEDRGSVYESCCESVEDCEHQCQTQIEVADEVVADADADADAASADAVVECELCPVYSSEKESGDSGGKESADSGEKDVQIVSKKPRKQRKKRR